MTSDQRRQLRNEGFEDGFHGRRPRSEHPEYRACYRRGRERRQRVSDSARLHAAQQGSVPRDIAD